jgi:undecaprenyl-diphosphatase
VQRILDADARWTQALRLPPERRGLRLAAAILAHSGDSWFWAAGLLLLAWQGAPAWGAMYRLTDPHSFPSGHAARAVLIATLVAAWGPVWLAPIVIVWAPLVAVARVAMGLHYVADILSGAILGLALAIAIASFYSPIP